MARSRLLIAAPELERWLDTPEALPETLQKLLARAQIASLEGDVPIASALGLKNIAAAPLCRLADDNSAGLDSTDEEAYWLRFDPVYLLPDLTAVWIHSPAELDGSAQALAPLLEEFGRMFEAEGIDGQFCPSKSYGLIQLAEPPDSDFIPLSRVIGRRLDEVLPSGSDQMRWRRMLNESQMIFHQFRALDDTRQQGLGLWFWGSGRLPTPPLLKDARMLAAKSVETLTDEWRGLARWMRLEIVEQFEYQPFSGTRIVHAEVADSADALMQLEQRWIRPAWQALSTGSLHQLMLVGTDRAWTAGRFDRWAFWRRAS